MKKIGYDGSHNNDPRKIGLKQGLRQLNVEQLQRVLNYPKEMVLDTYNYQDGKFCPLAVALELDSMEEPSHDKVFQILTEMGYTVYNTRGIQGEFYIDNRKEDLFLAVQEVIEEKGYFYESGPPEFVGTFHVKSELPILPLSETIQIIKELANGYDVYKADENGEAIEIPLEERDDLKPGMEVIVVTPYGICKMKIMKMDTNFTNVVWAENDDIIAILDFETHGGKHCWTSSPSHSAYVKRKVYEL